MTDICIADKSMRAYDRLIVAIKRKSPDAIINQYFETYKRLVGVPVDLEQVRVDAENYILHSQAGRTVVIHIDAPIAVKLLRQRECIEHEREYSYF